MYSPSKHREGQLFPCSEGVKLVCSTYLSLGASRHRKVNQTDAKNCKKLEQIQKTYKTITTNYKKHTHTNNYKKQQIQHYKQTLLRDLERSYFLAIEARSIEIADQ